MDLENELKQAMAEHVASTSAPGSLVAAVRRRHRRRVTRIRATITVAAVVAVAAVTPVYQAFQAAPAPDSKAGVGPANASTAPVPTLRSRYPQSTPGRAEATVSAPATRPARGRSPGARGWVTYLPPGLRQVGACVDSRAADRRTTICQWAGRDGAFIEVRLVADAGLVGPADVAAVAGSTTPILTYDRVHGRPAIVTDQPGVGRQVTWIERPGLGVLVDVTTPLRDRLMRVADGVHP